jgi:hypothetical protein
MFRTGRSRQEPGAKLRLERPGPGGQNCLQPDTWLVGMIQVAGQFPWTPIRIPVEFSLWRIFMNKRIDDIWSETPGLPKALLMGGIFFYLVSFLMQVVYTSTNPTGFWYTLTRTLRDPGELMIYAGMVLCAAALIGGGLAAGSSREKE